MWYLIWFVAMVFIVYGAVWSVQRLEERFHACPGLEKDMEHDFLRRTAR